MDARPVSGTPHVQTVQRVKDVFSSEDYAHPVEYIRKTGDKGRAIVEEWGSAGIGSEVVKENVLKLADKDDREDVGNLEGHINKMVEKGQDITEIGAIFQGIKAIVSYCLAWDFLRTNSLSLSKLGLGGKRKRVEAEETKKGAPAHTYHYDSGYVKVESADMSGGKPEKIAKARALNGRQGRGFVQGHQGISNMKHRFIAHVHIDKEEPEDKRIDIFNGTKDDGTKAEGWPGKVKEAYLTPAGTDIQSVNDAVAARGKADFEAFMAEKELVEM